MHLIPFISVKDSRYQSLLQTYKKAHTKEEETNFSKFQSMYSPLAGGGTVAVAVGVDDR